MDKKTLISVVISLLAIAAAGYSAWRTAQLEDEVLLRSKIVVIDFQGEMLKAISAGGDSDAKAAELAAAGERLVAAGYVVLDKRAVYAYDPAIEVKP